MLPVNLFQNEIKVVKRIQFRWAHSPLSLCAAKPSTRIPFRFVPTYEYLDSTGCTLITTDLDNPDAQELHVAHDDSVTAIDVSSKV